MPAAVKQKQARMKATVADLPFPGGRNSQVWKIFFGPPLIAWAGSQPDPFGTNGSVEREAAAIWKRIFPAVSLDEEAREILRRVVGIQSEDYY